MPFLNTPLTILEAWFGRRTAVLDRPRAVRYAALLVPLLFGLISVWMGQDNSWDVKNYHWYNPYALLNHRLEIDLAPGQFQSYFNPTIDLPYYLMTIALPGPVVGFVMGFVHGLNFILLLVIARQLLGTERPRTRLALLVAGAGVCGAGFLSELGNTMGDNLTSLLVLSSLYLLLRDWPALHAGSWRTTGILLLSGILMGVGSGLKLTNATYAAAACLALLTVQVPFGRRLINPVLYGCGAMAGLALSAGYWWVIMWQHFGNPVFPQFNQIFHSPLAPQVGVIDTVHLPHGILETLFWPFVFVANFQRVGEIPLRPAIMAVLYAAAIVFALIWLFERFAGVAGQAPARLSPKARFVLVFGLLAYLAWMKLFSIYRYLVPLELLAPVMLWLLVERIVSQRYAARVGGWLLAVATVVVFPVTTWGHVSWGTQAFSAQFPSFPQPASTIVFTAYSDPPMGWLATFVPPDVRVVALVGVPTSPAYVARIQATIAARPGPHYVMLGSIADGQAGLRRKINLVHAFGMTADAERCGRLDRLLHHVRFHAQVKFVPEAGQQCTLEIPPQNRIDVDGFDRTVFKTAQDNMAPFGLHIDETGCKRYPASIGAESFPFRLCPVTRQQ